VQEEPPIQQEPEVDDTESKESKVSQVLSNANIKKVILVMLLIMFFVPLFDTTTYLNDNENLDVFVNSVALLL